VRSFCFIDDAVEGVLKLMTSGAMTPVNIGSDEAVTVKDLALRAATAVGFDGSQRVAYRDGPKGVQGRNADLGAAAALGWTPRVTLDEGLRITGAFANYGWTTAIRGVEGGGKVESLTAHAFKTDEGDVLLKCPTEVSITDRREKELNDLGFISIVNAKGSDYAAFFGGQTTNKPKVYNKDNANASAELSSRLPYVLAASRFAHYIKVIMRDKVGSFQTRGGVEEYLNNWIADYVLLNDAAPQAMKARFPLSEARIDVTDVAGKPGVYNATVFLKPHFQMEGLTASIRLVAELPAAAG
jgi:type VI secretion system protein ImpC